MGVTLIFLIAVWFILTVLLIHKEQALVSTVILVVALGVVGFSYGLANSIAYLKSYDFSLLGVMSTIVLYLTLGVVWSFYKWYTYLRKNRSRYTAGEIKPEDIDKTVIGTWIAYWPFSVIAYLLADLLNDVIKWLVRVFEGIYNKIAVRALKQ